jgi:hypothetical protein
VTPSEPRGKASVDIVTLASFEILNRDLPHLPAPNESVVIPAGAKAAHLFSVALRMIDR